MPDRWPPDPGMPGCINAVIGLSNEIGFPNVSMCKIAIRAGISSSTLYVYFENKEDMFRKVYTEVKIRMEQECARDISSWETIEQSVKQICKNALQYIQNYTDEFLFIEQSCNSPFVTREMLDEIDRHSREIVEIFERGIAEGILKQTSPIQLISFCYYPIQQIFKECQKPNSMLPDTDFNLVFQMCWDAIRR